MPVSVIIPALNEAESIGHVLGGIQLQPVDEVIVVDGGSSDDTVSIAQTNGARVVHEPRRGYGRACASGVAAAKNEILVFLDADGADDVRRILELAGPVEKGAADMVLGSRLAGEIMPNAMPWQQRFGNLLSAWLIRRLYGIPITDLSPFRAVEQAKLLQLGMQEMTYGWPTEMIVKAARKGWTILEIPVQHRPRFGGRSKISGTVRGTFLAGYYILRTILRNSVG